MNAPLSLYKAQERLLQLVRPTAVEAVSTNEALDRYLAEPLVAKRTQPVARLSAMDGFAVAGPGPWTIVGESRCGEPFSGQISEGEATRISTGAHVPADADAIVLVEEAEVADDQLSSSSAEPKRYFRAAGSDFTTGAELLASGIRIGPAQLGLARMAGVDSLTVRKRPQIAILECGDELAHDPTEYGPHQIPATNGAMLSALIASEQCEIGTQPPVPDNLDAVAQALDDHRDQDLIVISGGASVGEHDLVRPALEKIGATIDFWRVAMKPGKPLMVATRGNQLIIGLPGNPVSSFVTGFLFVLPAIRKMLGASNCIPQPINLPTPVELPAGGPRRTFARAHWDGEHVTPLAQQDSGALASLANANALIERPEHCDAVKAGTYVPTYLFKNGGIA